MYFSTLIPMALLPALALSTPASTKSSPPSPTCAQATLLASGIALNIADQRHEQSALSAYSSLLVAAKSTIAPQAFSTAKAELLTFVVAGIEIRKINQAIAPPGNKAVPGLSTVAKAQATELALSRNLTGSKKHDSPIVKALAGDFSGGIKQNQENQAAATAGC